MFRIGRAYGDPWRRGRRRNQRSFRSVALVDGAATHDLRGTDVLVVPGAVEIVESVPVRSPAVAVLLLAFLYRLLPGSQVDVPRESAGSRFLGQVQFCTEILGNI